MSIPKSEVIWFNGEFVPWDEAKVHVLSHALHYGSSVFEGIRAYKTPSGPAILGLKPHVDRLFFSAKVMRMEIPYRICGSYQSDRTAQQTRILLHPPPDLPGLRFAGSLSAKLSPGGDHRYLGVGRLPGP
jgi:hypothetical protein